MASTSTRSRRVTHRVDGPVHVVEATLRGGDAIAERGDGIVEPGADPADVGVDVGDTLAEGLVDASFGGQDPVVDAVLGLVDTGADGVRDLRLLTSRLRGHLVHAHGERCEAPFEVLGDLLGHLVEPGLGGLGDRVDLLHEGARLPIELADAAVERGQVLLELILAVLELLDHRSGRRFDGGGEPGVGLVGHTADAEVQLVVAPLGLRGELAEALFDRREQRLDGLLALRSGRSLGGELALETLDLGGDLLAEPVQLLLNRGDDAGTGVGLCGHHTSFRGRTAAVPRDEACGAGGAEGRRRVVISSGGVVGAVDSHDLYRPVLSRS